VTRTSPSLEVLVVDDERPARDELAWLLDRDPRVHSVSTADSAPEALRHLQGENVDAVFLDIAMPGLSGLDLARVLSRFKAPPSVVFVTAHDEHAVDAFELDAVDYLLKPVREDRLAEAVRRVAQAARGGSSVEPDANAAIAVDLGGVTRFVSRGDVRFVEAHGDYARLHTASGSHLVRISMAVLEDQWREAGFVRIHRSLLVALAYVDEVRMDAGRCSVTVDGTELGVSRRHTRELRDLLVRRARPGGAVRS
jgi:DNA-binding LytR/AlgR family response regulator